MKKIDIFDATLRDGSHANKHSFTEVQVAEYCRAVDNLGFDVVFVGHGNGLGASSAQIGFSKVSDISLLLSARKELKKTKLGSYIIPGFGTIRDHIVPAIDAGTDVFEIGCHCTEADISKQHIEYLKSEKKQAYGTLMMIHMADENVLLENAKKMEAYGADGIILMDSAGNSIPNEVSAKVNVLAENLSIPVGIHSHNNLGMAVQNAISAVGAGARIVDGTMRGYGAGAGNCQLEIVCSLLNERYSDYCTSIDEMKLLKVSESIFDVVIKDNMGVSPLSIASGLAGVFSAFKEHAINAGKLFGVSPIDILMQVGKKKAVGGQEDMIIEIANAIKNKQK